LTGKFFKLNLTDATRHSGPSWRRLAVRPRPRVPASPRSVLLTAATRHSGPPSLVPWRRRKRPSRPSRPPPGIGPRCGRRPPRPPRRAGPGHTVRARSALGRSGHVRSHARCPAFGLTADTRRSGPRSLFRGGPNLTDDPAPGLTGLSLRPRPTDASLSLPGVEPEALTTAALAERARILPGAPAHPPAGGPGPGPPQRAEAERQVVAVKSTPGPRPRPRSAYPVLRSGRPGPAPGSGGEVMLRASAKRPPCGTGQAQCRVAGVKLGPQARPRQKKNSRRLFFTFFTPLTRRSVARGDPDPWRPSGPTRLAPGTVEGFPLHRPGARRKPPGGVDRLGDPVPALTPSREPHFRAALPRRVLAAARELHRERRDRSPAPAVAGRRLDPSRDRTRAVSEPPGRLVSPRAPSGRPRDGGRPMGGVAVLRTPGVKNLAGFRADAQWIVTTRLLYHLHDPTGQPSRMQGIYPRAR